MQYSNFAWDSHGGVDVKLSGGVFIMQLHWHKCDQRGIVLFFPIGMDSADTGQPPNGEIGTNHTYSQITQPGSNIIAPLYE
jgi:hypothetical protein